jgi:predicted nuclease of predicted toxin-antitoxin system
VRLLLDEHLPTALARALRAAGHDAVTLAEWRNGEYLSTADESVLAAAYEEQRVLVSGDVHTIPGLLEALAANGRHHAGVILTSSRSIRTDDVRVLYNSLLELLESDPDRDWQDHLSYSRSLLDDRW